MWVLGIASGPLEEQLILSHLSSPVGLFTPPCLPERKRLETNIYPCVDDIEVTGDIFCLTPPFPVMTVNSERIEAD